jgi:hypothetical protein
MYKEPMFKILDAFTSAKIIRINWKTVLFTPDDLLKGMNVELEHGTMIPQLNVTNDNPTLTAKIALAHLFEEPRYYEYLELVEDKKYADLRARIFQ